MNAAAIFDYEAAPNMWAPPAGAQWVRVRSKRPSMALRGVVYYDMQMDRNTVRFDVLGG